MKLLLFVLFFSANFQQQDEDFTVRNIGIALKAGSTKEFINYCSKKVEINFNGEKAMYNRILAEKKLKLFFKDYPPKDFIYVHQGAAPEGLKYTIGTYTYEGGIYRVVMLIKKIGNRYLIDTISFSTEE